MEFKNTIKSIAIGSFDGIHIAHKTLIDKADALIIIERNGGYLTPGFKRSYFTDKICCFYHFDVIKGLTPEAFVSKLKTDFPALETIVVGYDFGFGKNKAGNTETLEALFDGRVEVVQEVCVEGISVHSRTIKAYIREGNIAMANTLLGREYSIEGYVVSGQGLGKKELVPTLNLNVQAYEFPSEGVYATRTKVNGKWLDSVSFLGHRVTTDGSYAIESHILDVDIGVVFGDVQLSFLDFIRENKKFESLDALKVQINDDIAKAKELLNA
ncbi:MAG: bifunctional riboflavin kinase/FAD synthetase [Campylobacterota bacterium]|nr:bifunctional riboflavin kinase/FAD synthetase [Campylobacterota bacterium]